MVSDTGLHYVIERQPPHYHFKYCVFFVDENGYRYMEERTATLWGARRTARKLAKEWRKYRSQEKYVDEGLI